MKKFILGMFILTATFIGIPGMVSAQADVAICEGIGAVQGGTNCQDNPTEASVGGTLEMILNILSFIAGVAAVIMLIVAGLKYITSSGDGKGIAEAKSAIIYAIVGIIIVVLAQTIVRFVLTRATE